MPQPRRTNAPTFKFPSAGVSTQLVRLQHELETKNGYIGKLEILLRERLTRIDELTGKLEQSREQIRRLDRECEHLADMIRIMPQLASL